MTTKHVNVYRVGNKIILGDNFYDTAYEANSQKLCDKNWNHLGTTEIDIAWQIFFEQEFMTDKCST